MNDQSEFKVGMKITIFEADSKEQIDKAIIRKVDTGKQTGSKVTIESLELHKGQSFYFVQFGKNYMLLHEEPFVGGMKCYSERATSYRLEAA